MTGGVAAALERELPHAYFLSSGGEGLTSDQSAGFGVRDPCTHRLTRPQDKGKVMSSRGLPVLAGENGLSRYLSEIRKFPLLSAEDEYMFAKRWQAHEDPEAA